MAWIWLMLAGALEVVWAIGLKYTDGFTRPLPSVVTLAAMVASLSFLALAVGVAILGMALFGEPRTIARIGCIPLIVASIAGLKIASPQ